MDHPLAVFMRGAKIGALPMVQAMLLATNQQGHRGRVSGVDADTGRESAPSAAHSLELQPYVYQQFNPSSGASEPCFSDLLARLVLRFCADGHLAEQEKLLGEMLQSYFV